VQYVQKKTSCNFLQKAKDDIASKRKPGGLYSVHDDSCKEQANSNRPDLCRFGSVQDPRGMGVP